ncbi:MAG TPA: hypothetical protein VFO27_10240, partial [Bryobacteraceae bacterium]|nr:hypothetical protein [Bryobacteraceae bacterium]
VSNQVIVAGSYWSFYGANTFGITLVPMLIGIAMLFWSGRSTLAWLLTGGGALFILAGVIVNMHIYFQPTSLFNTGRNAGPARRGSRVARARGADHLSVDGCKLPRKPSS